MLNNTEKKYKQNSRKIKWIKTFKAKPTDNKNSQIENKKQCDGTFTIKARSHCIYTHYTIF